MLLKKPVFYFSLFYVAQNLFGMEANRGQVQTEHPKIDLVSTLDRLDRINDTVLQIIQVIKFQERCHSDLFYNGNDKPKDVWISLFIKFYQTVQGILEKLEEQFELDVLLSRETQEALRLNIFATLVFLDSLGCILPKELQFTWDHAKHLQDSSQFNENILKAGNEKLSDLNNLDIAIGFILKSLSDFEYIFNKQRDNFDQMPFYRDENPN